MANVIEKTYWVHRLNTIYSSGMNCYSNKELIWYGYVHDLCIHMLFATINFLDHYFYFKARSDEHFFFGKDQLSQKLWQSICVHTQQRKVL